MDFEYLAVTAIEGITSSINYLIPVLTAFAGGFFTYLSQKSAQKTKCEEIKLTLEHEESMNCLKNKRERLFSELKEFGSTIDSIYECHEQGNNFIHAGEAGLIEDAGIKIIGEFEKIKNYLDLVNKYYYLFNEIFKISEKFPEGDLERYIDSETVYLSDLGECFNALLTKNISEEKKKHLFTPQFRKRNSRKLEKYKASNPSMLRDFINEIIDEYEDIEKPISLKKLYSHIYKLVLEM